jgi:hypothetical protein
VAALPLPGTGDVVPFKIWSHAASTSGVAQMYGVGGTPPERRLHAWGGWEATVNYPPVALYELALVGLVYGTAFPGFPDSAVLTAGVKLLPLAAEAAIACLLFWAVRRQRPAAPAAARFAALAFWLNPAAIVATPVLGYVDALFALPALGALIAAVFGSAWLSGGLLAVAVLTKPQAILLAPAVGLALVNRASLRFRRSGLKATLLAAAGAVLASAIVLAPVLRAGAWPNFAQAMLSFGRHDLLSGQAANAWWIVTYLMRAAYAVADMGAAEAFLSPVRRPLAITRVIELGYPNPRLAATLFTLAVMAWGLWVGRRARDLSTLALVGAWVCYVYFVCALQVHENHFYMIVPLLSLTAAARPEWRALFWLLSAGFALNLNLFYGFGDRVGFALPRTLTGIDATVWLSAANVAALAWFAVRLRRGLHDTDPAATAGRAGIPRPPESSSP